ncbi:MAG: hypothetical protein ACKVWV_04015 [Planctomycetota bacterium]
MLGVWASACDRNPQPTSTPPTAAHARLAELVALLAPIEEVVTSDKSDARFIRAQELLGELRNGDRSVGLAALEVLRREEEHRPVEVERGLLDVASHAAPEDARPLLESLVLQYGPSLSLRTEALLCLAETSPQRAIEIVQPLITRTRASQTLPPAEFLVSAWVTACEKTGRSPVKELADVATNLFQEEAARIRATKELGRHKEPLAQQALSAILIESTGDGYLRRMAAQGLRDTLPRETACSTFQRVAEREADMNFAKFLADLLEKNCAP